MKKLKVLIVEDESIISLHIKNSVKSFGHEVVAIVEDSHSALRLVENEKVDIALVDISIQGDVDGIQTASVLNKVYNIPIIFLTAFTDMGTLKRASNIDFIGYIVKPFRDDELETMINLAILQYDLNKEQQKLNIDEKYSYCFDTSKLYHENKTISLTNNENRLLQLLLHAKGSTVTYDTIDSTIWCDKVMTDATRRQLFYRLKVKLLEFPLVVDKGIGYRVDIFSEV